MNWGDLQTINDDRVLGSWQVPWHRHENMEIFGYVVEGSCHHVDSLGNDVEVPAGSVQRMSAGSGIEHTEGNTGSGSNRYLQLWIQPRVSGGPPCHDVYTFQGLERHNQFFDVTRRLPIRQDARLWSGQFTIDYTWTLQTVRSYYVYVVLGSAVINGISVREGDGLAITDESLLSIREPQALELVVFDLRSEVIPV
jgi:hypothetical protein